MNCLEHFHTLFFEFINNYDLSNTNLQRKVIHSFSVAEKAFKISCNMGLKTKDQKFCYLLGLFHDLGRFEQMKLYKTFNDSKSVDHGDLSELLLEKYSEKFNGYDFNLLKSCIKNHTKDTDGKSKREIMFSKILKNADAYANLLTSANGIQQLFVEKDGHTEELLNDFLLLKPLYKHDYHTKLDRVLKLTSMCYYITQKFIISEILENNYIDCIYETYSPMLNNNDKKTLKHAFKILKNKLEEKIKN